MVEDTGEASGADAVRALGWPLHADVKTADNGLPIALRRRSRWLKVEAVTDLWRIDDEWWRERSVSRMYYRCVVDQGLRVTLYRDLVTGRWYWQQT